jgi:general secretion pathway protein H
LAISRAKLAIATPRPRQAGFTLLELLIVISIIAIASVGVSLGLRDSARTALDQDAERLIALLESNRALSRTSGKAVRWSEQLAGFRFDGTPTGSTAQAWLRPDIRVQWDGNASGTLLLGPEPIIEAQAITLRLQSYSLRIATDGLRPFSIQTPP